MNLNAVLKDNNDNEKCKVCKVYEMPFNNASKDIVKEVNPDIKPLIRKNRNLQARVTNEIATSKSALAFRNKEIINDFVLDLLTKGHLYKAAMFVFNCNTGFRNGDNQSLTVADLTKSDGSIKDYITLGEDKTDKFRTVWINDTTKKIIKYLIDKKGLKPNNYIFRNDGNRTAYIDYFIYIDKYEYDNNGKKIGCITTLDKYDDNGNIREVYDVVMVKDIKDKYNNDGTLKEVAPMLPGSVTRWLKSICNSIGVDGRWSSHSFRQTYAYFISQGWEDNRLALAACADFGHSSLNVTLAHYMGIDPEELKQHQLNLNLGKEAVDLFLESFTDTSFERN